MADSSSAQDSLDALVKSITDSIQSVSAPEQAISQQTESVLKATTDAATELVKNNAYSAEPAQENLKMQKAMIERTIDAITSLPLSAGGTSGGDA